ncbi:MAG: hypothetical protein LBM19_01305 [Holosporales bacterium]|jgi:hypothetical protein|nr:hypothetical protein [Holosporales bacterium]
MTSTKNSEKGRKPKKNAAHIQFGFEFQSNAAIVLMLKNIKSAEFVKVEGEYEDIEITLDSGKKFYSQVKAVFDPEDTSNLNKKLKDALKSMNDVPDTEPIEQLIYVTNSPNPFNEERTMFAFSSGYNFYKLDKLPKLCEDKIIKLCDDNDFKLDKSKLSVCVIQFHGDGENKFKVIKETINEFLNSIGEGDRGIGQEMLEGWQRAFSLNASESDTKVTIGKKDMIWSIIARICRLSKEEAENAGCDEGELDEITRKYEDIMKNKTECFEFVTKVISEYNGYKTEISSKERQKQFIKSKWRQFKDDFACDSLDKDLLPKLIQLIISNVLRSRFRISDIKKEVNLK